MKKLFVCAMIMCNFAYAVCPEYRDDIESEISELDAQSRSIENDIDSNRYARRFINEQRNLLRLADGNGVATERLGLEYELEALAAVFSDLEAELRSIRAKTTELYRCLTRSLEVRPDGSTTSRTYPREIIPLSACEERNSLWGSRCNERTTHELNLSIARSFSFNPGEQEICFVNGIIKTSQECHLLTTAAGRTTDSAEPTLNICKLTLRDSIYNRDGRVSFNNETQAMRVSARNVYQMQVMNHNMVDGLSCTTIESGQDSWQSCQVHNRFFSHLTDDHQLNYSSEAVQRFLLFNPDFEREKCTQIFQSTEEGLQNRIISARREKERRLSQLKNYVRDNIRRLCRDNVHYRFDLNNERVDGEITRGHYINSATNTRLFEFYSSSGTRMTRDRRVNNCYQNFRADSRFMDADNLYRLTITELVDAERALVDRREIDIQSCIFEKTRRYLQSGPYNCFPRTSREANRAEILNAMGKYFNIGISTTIPSTVVEPTVPEATPAATGASGKSAKVKAKTKDAKRAVASEKK